MKGKTKFLIGLIVGILVGALAAVGVYFLTVGEVAWQEYIENDLIPNVVIVLTSISTILVAAIPIISKVTTAVNSFKSATEDVNETVQNNSKNEKRIADLEGRLDRIETAAVNAEEILRLGFCNLDELVKKGYGAEIAKVGQDESEKIED